MDKLTKCAKCGKKPATKANKDRGGWKAAPIPTTGGSHKGKKKIKSGGEPMTVSNTGKELSSTRGATQKFASGLRSDYNDPTTVRGAGGTRGDDKGGVGTQGESRSSPVTGMGNSLSDRFAARDMMRAQKKLYAAQRQEGGGGAVAKTSPKKSSNKSTNPKQGSTKRSPRKKKAVKQKTAGKCDNCPAVAELTCKQCEERFCRECDQKLHSRVKTKGHDRTPIGDRPRKAAEGGVDKGSEDAGEDPRAPTEITLDNIFDFFCHRAPASTDIDNSKWAKCIKAMGLIDNKKITSTDVDLIFTKVKAKGARRLDLDGFHNGFLGLAKTKFGRSKDSGFDKWAAVAALLKTAKKTEFKVAKKKAGKKGDVLSRLTDSSGYTGAHKHRFDDEGKGRGLDGRDRSAGGVAGIGSVPSELDWGEASSAGPGGFDGTDFAVGTSLGAHHNTRHNAARPEQQGGGGGQDGGFDGTDFAVGTSMGHHHNTQHQEGNLGVGAVQSSLTSSPGQNAHKSTVNLFSGALHLPDEPRPGSSAATATLADVTGAHLTAGIPSGAPHTTRPPAGKPSDQPGPAMAAGGGGGCCKAGCSASKVAGSSYCAAHST